MSFNEICSIDYFSLCFVNSTNRRALIFSPRSSRLTFVGIFSLTQIFGPSALLHGFTLQPLNSYSVYNLSSQSALSIETSANASKSVLHDQQIRSYFDHYRIQLPLPEIYPDLIKKLAKSHQGLAIFYIEQMDTTWIESIKRLNSNILANQWLFSNKNDNTDDEEQQGQNTLGFKQLWSGMGAFKDHYVNIVLFEERFSFILFVI